MWCIRAVYTSVLTGEKLYFVSAKIDIFRLALTARNVQGNLARRRGETPIVMPTANKIKNKNIRVGVKICVQPLQQQLTK